jgi:AcrR family transcriptional regulator
MTSVADRPLRADAARNAERILRAARDVYAELGPEAPVEAIARRAGVGERTLYRRFPAKSDLVRAALDQSIAEDLTPVIEDARRADDPLRGLAQLIDAAISLGAREHSLLTAARRAGSLTLDISTSLHEALTELARRGQQAGRVRADLVADDLPRLIVMLYGVLSTMDSTSDGWRRYVALILDAICPRRPLFVLHPHRAAGRSSQIPSARGGAVAAEVTSREVRRLPRHAVGRIQRVCSVVVSVR